MSKIITAGTESTRTIPRCAMYEMRLPMPHRASYSGPDIPSRRIRQKCTAMNRLASSGKKMQCRM